MPFRQPTIAPIATQFPHCRRWPWRPSVRAQAPDRRLSRQEGVQKEQRAARTGRIIARSGRSVRGGDNARGDPSSDGLFVDGGTWGTHETVVERERRGWYMRGCIWGSVGACGSADEGARYVIVLGGGQRVPGAQRRREGDPRRTRRRRRRVVPRGRGARCCARSRGQKAKNQSQPGGITWRAWVRAKM